LIVCRSEEAVERPSLFIKNYWRNFGIRNIIFIFEIIKI